MKKNCKKRIVIYVTEPKYVISLHFINHASTRMDEYVEYFVLCISIYSIDYVLCNDVCNKHTIQIYFIPSITKLAVSASLWLMQNCLPYPLKNGRMNRRTHRLTCIHLASGLGDDIFVENLFILYENTENRLSILIRFICILGAQIPYHAFSISL